MRYALVFFLVTTMLSTASGPAPAQTNGLTAADGFTIEKIADVSGARELAFAPDGALFAGTQSGDVFVIAGAEGSPKAPQLFTSIDDAPAAGVAFSGNTLYVGTQHGVWRIAYESGRLHPAAKPQRIAEVRPGNGKDHVTTTVAIVDDRVYASVGSSCNACTESDPTRATIQEMNPDGTAMKPKAIRARNAIALAVDPQTKTLWAAIAGQDELQHGHPYELFDPVTVHAGTVNYGWPVCYEDRKAIANADCSEVTVARVVFPAYVTPIGAVFYPADQRGKYAFPGAYRGGAFLTWHGSWHLPLVAPRIIFVPIRDDKPQTPVDWNDPTRQYREFVTGFQNAIGYRSGRPTGIAVGPQGSLFIADDYANAVYRVRPAR